MRFRWKDHANELSVTTDSNWYEVGNVGAGVGSV